MHWFCPFCTPRGPILLAPTGHSPEKRSPHQVAFAAWLCPGQLAYSLTSLSTKLVAYYQWRTCSSLPWIAKVGAAILLYARRARGSPACLVVRADFADGDKCYRKPGVHGCAGHNSSETGPLQIHTKLLDSVRQVFDCIPPRSHGTQPSKSRSLQQLLVPHRLQHPVRPLLVPHLEKQARKCHETAKGHLCHR